MARDRIVLKHANDFGHTDRDSFRGTCAAGGSTAIIGRYAGMTPVVTGIRPEPRAKSADHCWHVRYQFCGLSAQITVLAENEVDARAKAIDQLRMRGLRIA
jgi:hypothetical protein